MKGSSLPVGPAGLWHSGPEASACLVGSCQCLWAGPPGPLMERGCCSFHSLRGGSTGLLLVSQRRGENPGTCWQGQEKVQSVSLGHV